MMKFHNESSKSVENPLDVVFHRRLYWPLHIFFNFSDDHDVLDNSQSRRRAEGFEILRFDGIFLFSFYSSSQPAWPFLSLYKSM